MAWTAPMTAVTGNVFTAALFNQHVRDNLLKTEAAVATEPMGLLAVTGANSLIYRFPNVEFIGDYEDTTGTTYDDLNTFGPSVVVFSGTKVLVSFGAAVSNNTGGLGSRVSIDVFGAFDTVAASDTNSFYAESDSANDGFQGTWTYIIEGLTGGNNLYTAKYRTTAGGGTSTFGHRVMAVVSF